MATWGPTSDVYTLPTVRLTSADAPWLADAAVVSWQVERELVGSTLPGNIRARSGLSIGDASAVVAVESGTLAPWAAATSRRVTVGARARLFVQADDGGTLDLGAWLIDPTSGNLTSRETQVDLTEAQYVGRKPKQALPVRGIEALPVDPVWMIARLAEQVGFRAAPMPLPGQTFLDLPLDGAFDGRGLPGASIDGLDGWAVLPGDVIVGTVGDGNLTTTPDPIAADTWKVGGSIYLTFNVVGEARVLDVAQAWKVLVNSDGTLGVCNSLAGTVVTGTFVPGLSADWPTRVQVEIQRDYNISLMTPTWTAFRARARSAPDAAWSAWVEDSTDAAEQFDGIATTYFLLGQDFDGVTITPADPGSIAAVQLSRGEPSADLWAPATTRLKPLGGRVQVPTATAGDDVWTTVQNIAAANLAAVHLNRDGVLTVLDRDDLAGAGADGVVTLVDEEWTDLAWTLDPADAADRLEVAALVPAIQKATVTATSTPAPELWRAEEVIEVPAGGQIITLNVEVDGKAAEGLFTSFVTPADLVIDPTLASRFSVVCHATGRDGSGALSTVDKFSISAIPLSPSRMQLKFRNTGTVPLYLVDANGEPCVIVRASRVATFETPQTVQRGAAEDEAESSLAVDLGVFVQRIEDMEDIADYLWARLGSAPSWKAASVQCRLDWSHDIGKVLRLIHVRTGLEEKALITKVTYDGSAGEITQTLDLVRLPWTWSDFDQRWAGATWSSGFDSRWAGSTWDAYDADPLDLGA